MLHFLGLVLQVEIKIRRFILCLRICLEGFELQVNFVCCFYTACYLQTWFCMCLCYQLIFQQHPTIKRDTLQHSWTNSSITNILLVKFNPILMCKAVSVGLKRTTFLHCPHRSHIHTTAQGFQDLFLVFYHTITD